MKKDAYIQELANKALAEFDSSRGYYTQINTERNRALAYYMQLPLGNESDGFSRYVTSDVRDTVDWSLAQLMEMFMTGAAPIRFNPVNAGDVGQAELETKYCQHVMFEENNGFLIFNTWFKDALISKNGVVKAHWQNRIDEIPEDYESIGFDEYMLLVDDADYEIKKVKVTAEGLDGEFSLEELAQAVQALGEAGMMLLQSALFNVKGCRIKDESGVKIENIAPERFYISSQQLGIDLEKADYCAEQMFLSRNELIAQGFDYEEVMEFPTSNIITDAEDSVTRYVKETGNITNGGFNTAGELIEVIEHYIRDSKSQNPKLYCIRTVAGKVIDWEEAARMPYHVITPKVNPYRFYGDSLADEVIDIQFSRSNLWRAAFDNIKYSVVPRHTVKGDVDLEALNDYVPSGIIQMGANGEIGTIQTPFVAGDAIEVSNVLEGQRAERTGFSRETAGLDPNALANSTNLMGSAILNLSQLRTKMIASTFANTGVKSLYNHVRELMLKFERRDKMFSINGKFVPVSPRGWLKSRSTTVKTGLGHAGKLESINALNAVLALQEKLVSAQGGVWGDFIQPKNIYSAIQRSMELAGVIDVETFFMNPENAQPPQPEPTPQDKQTMAYVEVEKYKADKKAEMDIYKAETDASVEIFKTNQATLAKNKELALQYQKSLIEQNEKILTRIKQNREIKVEKPLVAKAEPKQIDISPALKQVGESLSKSVEKLGEMTSAVAENQYAIAQEQNKILSKKKKKRIIRNQNNDIEAIEEID